MKILFVGLFNSRSTNCCQADAFEALGHEVQRYDYEEQPLPKPEADFIFLSKPIGLDPEIIEAWAQQAQVGYWYMDAIWNLTTEVIQQMQACHFVCCGLQKPTDIARQHCDQVYRIPQVYDPRDHYPMDLPKAYDVTFIGNLQPIGMVHLERFLYKKYLDFQHFDGVYGEEHSKIVSQSKINLNFTELDRGGTSTRIHRLLGSGGFVLTMPWDGMEEDFTVGEHLDVFRDPVELQDKVQFYLENEEFRERVARQGWEYNQRYDHQHFAERVLKLHSLTGR